MGDDVATRGRFPGYDVLSKRRTPSWDAVTRAVVDVRLAVQNRPRFLPADLFAVLRALCGRILPQPTGPEPAPLAGYVDAKLLEDRRDGYRRAELPPLREAWTRGLAALEAEARDAHGRGFADLGSGEQDLLIAAMQRGELTLDAWGGMPCAVFFTERVCPDIVRAYYAHPNGWNEIGFGGPASPRGYVRIELDRRDPWEASEARPGHEARALRENARVGR